MKELWDQAIAPYNLPLTLLVGLMLLFWLVSLLGFFGLDMDELDIPDDADPGTLDFLAMLMRAVNANHVPVTIVLSILLVSVWAVALTANFYLNGAGNLLIAGGVFVGSVVLGLILTRLITQPLVPLMRNLKEAEIAQPVIGDVGIVRSITIDQGFGQIEVIRNSGAPAFLNARLESGAPPLERGSRVIILSQDPISGIYLARTLPIDPLEQI